MMQPQQAQHHVAMAQHEQLQHQQQFMHAQPFAAGHMHALQQQHQQPQPQPQHQHHPFATLSAQHQQHHAQFFPTHHLPTAWQPNVPSPAQTPALNNNNSITTTPGTNAIARPSGDSDKTGVKPHVTPDFRPVQQQQPPQHHHPPQHPQQHMHFFPPGHPQQHQSQHSTPHHLLMQSQNQLMFLQQQQQQQHQQLQSQSSSAATINVTPPGFFHHPGVAVQSQQMTMYPGQPAMPSSSWTAGQPWPHAAMPQQAHQQQQLQQHPYQAAQHSLMPPRFAPQASGSTTTTGTAASSFALHQQHQFQAQQQLHQPQQPTQPAIIAQQAQGTKRPRSAIAGEPAGTLQVSQAGAPTTTAVASNGQHPGAAMPALSAPPSFFPGAGHGHHMAGPFSQWQTMNPVPFAPAQSATQTTKNAAQAKPRTITSKYRGVSWHKRDRRWFARLWCDQKTRFIGSYRSEQRAALAVDEAEIKLSGRAARKLNFPDPDERDRLRRKFDKEDKEEREREEAKKVARIAKTTAILESKAEEEEEFLNIKKKRKTSSLDAATSNAGPSSSDNMAENSNAKVSHGQLSDGDSLGSQADARSGSGSTDPDGDSAHSSIGNDVSPSSESDARARDRSQDHEPSRKLPAKSTHATDADADANTPDEDERRHRKERDRKKKRSGSSNSSSNDQAAGDLKSKKKKKKKKRKDKDRARENVGSSSGHGSVKQDSKPTATNAAATSKASPSILTQLNAVAQVASIAHATAVRSASIASTKPVMTSAEPALTVVTAADGR